MGVLRRTPLVGRADELAALRRAVTASWTGSATTVLLSGEAGIGKTRLLSELLTTVADPRTRLLVGTCTTLAAREVPWAPWLDVVRELRRLHGDEAAAALLPDRVAVLAPLAPGLAAPGATSAHPPPAQVYSAMTDLLLGVADTCPTLVVLEDLQWADDQSLALLLHLTRSARTHPLAVVVTLRTEDPAYDDVKDRVAELERLPGAVRIRLGPLAHQDAAAHARHVTEGRLDAARLDHLAELSGGVPLFVEELVGALERDGSLVAPRPLQERLLHLSPPARAVVECLAVAVAPPQAAVLLRATGRDGAEFDAALAECFASAVLVTRGGRVEFRHALLREAAVGLLLPHHSQELNRSWAQTLRESPDDEGRDLERAVWIAHHWRAAGEPALALDAGLRAAEQARHASAYATQLQLLEDAARLWPAVPDAQARAGGDLATLLTEAALAARAALADPAHCLALLARARQVLVAGGPGPDVSARTAWLDLLAAGCRDLVAQHQSADETVARVEAIPREPPTRTWVLAAVQAVGVLAQAGRPEQGDTYAREAVRAAGTLQDAALESGAIATLAFNELYLGRLAEALRLAQAATRLAEQAGDLQVLHGALITLQGVYWYLGDFDGALRTTLRDLELLGGDQPGPLPSAWGLQRTNLAELLLDLGDWDGAERLLGSVLAREDMPPSVSAFAGRLVRHLAAWREGGGAHRRCVDPGGLEDVYLQDLVPIRYTAAEQAAAAGDLVGVRTSVREVLADDRTAVMSPVVLPLLEVVARTEADHTRSGRTDPDPAAGSWTLDRVRHFLALLPPANPRDRAYVAHVEAELLRHEGTDDTGTWSDVVDRWRETPMPYHLARALLRFADAAAPTDQRPAAVAAAKEAASIAERLDADPLRQAASSIGRRVGLHLGPSAPGRGLELLTSRELEVLQLLAGGASNAEVAEALVISPKTVAVHVSHILAKLGATSRGAAVATALRTGIARLDDLGPSPTGTALTGS